ncbi:hypothetical protein HA402_007884 [Bradysia odoriphaga]|nr:hypothetical protein HA402_007884 [Bradysia odoriphaga]
MSFFGRCVLVNIMFVYVHLDIYVAIAQETLNSNRCWNSNGQCNIEANLKRDAASNPFTVNFNCSDNVVPMGKSGYGFRQIKGVQIIQLNGCNVTQNGTIGVEYIDDPFSVTHLTIYSFKVKTFYAKHFDQFKSLVVLQLIDNVFEEIIDESFQDSATIQTLVISNNNLKVIAPHAVAPLNNLMNLTVVEPFLAIYEMNFTFCYSLKHVRLAVNVYEWQALPRSMETLEIFNTTLSFPMETFELDNCTNLQRITITQCQFDSFPAIESASLQTLNLTENNLPNFPEDSSLPNLEVLDLSGNQINEINGNSVKSMVKLRELYIVDNRIERISKQAFDSNQHLEILKLSGNRLKSMEFTDRLAQRSLQIFIDDNPWSCKWVLNVSSEHPTIFAIFHYNKYLNRLNVHGLNCLYYEVDGYNVYESSVATEIIPITSTLNSTLAKTFEMTHRRNPKNTVLITIIILVVGVAVLFFLLYLHIKCRENTVEPFYRSLPYDTHQMSDRIDIIRRNLPPTDYEAPIAARDADQKEVIY